MRTLVAKDLLDIRTVGQPVPLADGRGVVLTWRGVDPEPNRNLSRLCRWAPAPGAQLRFLTRGPSDDRPALSPDGRWLAFLSDRGRGRQIHLLPMEGGEARPLTRVAGGVLSFLWSPDGRGLYFVAAVPGGEELRVLADGEEEEQAPEVRHTRDVRVVERLYHKLDGRGYLDGRFDAVGYVSLEGEMRLLAGGPFHHALGVPLPSGDEVLVLAHLGPRADEEYPVRDVYRLDSRGVLTRLTRVGLGIREVAATPAGDLYLSAVSPEAHGYAGAHLYRLQDRERVQDLTGHLPGSVGDESVTDVPVAPGRSLWVDRQGRVGCLWSQEGRVEVRVLEPGDQLRVAAGGERVITGATLLADGSWVLAASDPVTPSYVSWEKDGQELARIDPNPQLGERNLSRPQTLPCRAPGGPPLQAWYLPPASPVQRRVPMVLYIHGGPMAMYGYRFVFDHALLAAQGWAVVYGNPRGSLGYGDAFCQDIEGDWGHHDYEDVMAMVDEALRQHPEVDPQRLAVVGGSYGGFLVNWIVGHTQRFRAAVTMRSVVNRLSAMGTSDLGYLRVPQFGVPWWEDPRPYLHQSPLMWASSMRTPLLIEHQEGDLRCPVEQGEQLFTALKLQGRPVRMVRYPGEFHGMSRDGRPWHRVHRAQEMVTWLGRYLEEEVLEEVPVGEQPGAASPAAQKEEAR
jgi:dipeptidyl aminopeptidase/acylaminoacyl peptidase